MVIYSPLDLLAGFAIFNGSDIVLCNSAVLTVISTEPPVTTAWEVNAVGWRMGGGAIQGLVAFLIFRRIGA